MKGWNEGVSCFTDSNEQYNVYNMRLIHVYFAGNNTRAQEIVLKSCETSSCACTDRCPITRNENESLTLD